ncbi:MAG: APH(3')-I family aminoglycoside O-phosphotransferase [Nitrospira sp.]|nr:APH(3')-I family aminoglycoside O-phosphotransferase [Nitrospira sp.]
MIDKNREEFRTAVPVPASMATAIAGYKWTRDTIGAAGGAVYRLNGKTDAPDMFLKFGQNAVADDVADEATRLRWLARYLPVPTVAQCIRTSDGAWLLMTAMPGETAFQTLEAQPDSRFTIVDALAAFLRRLHAIPVDECPFNSGHTYRLALARKRIDAGLVDVRDFDDVRQGWSAEEVWKALQNFLPLVPDPVVTHGDFSLDNLLMQQGQVVGCIDTGRLGIADRYQDLAVLWNYLEQYGTALQARLLQQYGIPNVDVRKLEFHLILDELF